MRRWERLSGIRSARVVRSAAKVESLRGETSTNAGFDGLQLMLDGMRVYLHSRVGYPRLFLVPCPGGIALCMQISHGPRVWLIAEHSKRVRIFKRVETALNVCKALGAEQVVVMLDDHDGSGAPARDASSG